jgi:hypothetical protein
LIKPLIILRFPSGLGNEEAKSISTYLSTHAASTDYHFIVITDAEWVGPIQFTYFNENGLQTD